MKKTSISPDKLKAEGRTLGDVIIHHRITVMAIIILFSVGAALYITQGFIDIPRNENRYNEEALLIRYKAIDSEILAEFQAEQQDQEIEVNSDFDPDRNNPFAE